MALCAVGPRLGNSPVPSIVQCLARKDGTDDFYQLKVSKPRPGPSELAAPAAVSSLPSPLPLPGAEVAPFLPDKPSGSQPHSAPD